MQWGQDRRSLEPPQTADAHQLPGAPGSSLGSEMLCQGQKQPQHLPEDRHHISTDIHQQVRGNDIPTTELSSLRAMVVVHEENILLKAQHLWGVHNPIADNEPRVMKDWKLNPIIFQQIDHRLGPLNWMFASRLAHQLPDYQMQGKGSL